MRPRGSWFAPLLALAMLSGIAAMRASWQRVPGDPARYHHGVRAAALTMPQRIGTWPGADQVVPQPAVDLLKPNVVVCRGFVSLTGISAELLLVQCQDPRDLIGHYPPICYPSQGWVSEGQSSLV